MAPGPVQIPASVLKELARPMIHHRTPEFDGILNETLGLLREFFCTEQPVYMLTATGSGGMESALVNTLSPGDHVLVIVSGKFGERWRDMARAFGYRVSTLDVVWGESVDPAAVSKFLEKNPDVKAVLTQVCETSTGALHPIESLAKLIRSKSGTLLIVDAITAMGAVPLKIEEWGVDVVVAGSQKAFQLPTGLAFVTFSKKAWAFVDSAKSPRFYFDIRFEAKANANGETYFSSPVSLIRGLRSALQEMLKDGVEFQIRKMEALAEATRKAAVTLGFEVFAKNPSTSVTALRTPPGVDGQKVRSHLEKNYNVTIAGGQDQLKGKIVRIGHLGHIGPREIVETIGRLGLTLGDLGWKCDTEKAVRMAEDVLRQKYPAK